MMSKELEERISQFIQLSGLNQVLKKEIMSYIAGEQDEIKLSPIPNSIKDYLYWIVEEQIGGKEEEQILRCCRVMMQLEPEQFFYKTLEFDSCYSLYHKLELSKETVVKNVWEALDKLFTQGTGYINHMINNRIRRYELGKNKSRLGEANFYYGEEFRKYLGKQQNKGLKLPLLKSKQGEYAQVILYMKAIEAFIEEEDPSKLTALEDDIEKVLPWIYSEHPKFKEVYSELVRERFKGMVLIITWLVYNKSDKLKELLRLQIEWAGTKYCEETLKYIVGANIWEKTFDNLLDEIQVSVLYKVKYYAEQLVQRPLAISGPLYYNHLDKIYEKEPQVLKEAYEEFKEKKQSGVFSLFAFLRTKGNSFTSEDMHDLEMLLKFNLRKLEKRLEKNPRRKDLEAYLMLLMMYEESELAREEFKVIIKRKQRNVLTEFVVATKLFYKTTKGNELEAIDLPTEEIIESVIEENPIFPKDVLIEFVKLHLEEADELMNRKITEGKDVVIGYVEALYTVDIGMKTSTLVAVFKHPLKSVLQFMEKFVLDREAEVRPEMEKLHQIKNKNMQESLQRIEQKWDSEKHTQKIEASENAEEVAQYLETIYQVKNEKLIPYLETINWSEVKDQSGNPLPPILLKYYLSEYMLTKDVEILKPCEAVKKYMSKKGVRAVIDQLYEHWLEEAADTKKKNILVIYALQAEDTEIAALKKQIDQWTEAGRGALAAFAVRAMAMNGSNIALMLTESISKKYKNKQVKAAAANAMTHVAEVKGISKEELADKIVPNLGFNEKREMRLDYGSRSFKIILTPELTLTIFDETKNKVVKSLPKPNAQDDVEKAEEAKRTLTGLKKQIKVVLTMQKKRLSKALLTGRSWSQESFEALFIKNPIMNGFAVSLIWGEYDETDKLLGTFRAMEDGSFNTLEEEEYEFKENTWIKLLHPMDLTKEEKEAWKQQLEDYEIIQAISQLDLPVYELEEEDKHCRTFNRLKNEVVYFGKVLGAMEKYEWERTAALDAGCFEGFYYEEEQSDIGLFLRLDMPYMGMGPTETVKIDELIFYKKGKLDVSGYYQEEVMNESIIPLKEVPDKVLSFGLMVIYSIKSKEGNE